MARFALPAIILLGLALRIGYAVAIYEPTLLPYFLDDFVLYRMGAEAIASGDLTFTSDLFLLRPPLYPLLLAALNTDPLLIIGANILLATAIIPLSCLLARQLCMPERYALLANFIVAVDLTSIKYSGVLVAEPLANLLLALAFVSLLKAWVMPKASTAVAWAALAGALVLLSALTRPSAYLLWLPLAIWLAFARRAGGGGGVFWQQARC